MELQGKIALVTGASRRIGREIALALAAAGTDVAVHYLHSAAQAQQLTAQIRAMGRRAEALQADLAEPRQVADLFTAVGAAFGRLDVLVNNAAVCHPTPIDTLTAQQWDAEFAVNARATALCIRYALPLMSAGTAIVNIADAATDARPDHPAYCASKTAVVALTKSCAAALAPRGIRVNAVSPGIALWQETDGEQRKQQLLSRIPLGRIGGAESVAQAVLFLLRNDYVTAQDLRVDGGWHMG